jgi:Ca-activated chloride channel family protein
VIDLRQQEEPDPQLADFARSGGGKAHRATNGDQVRWALLEIVTGQSQLVAADARLKVTFNPKTVLEYRLLGHEAKAMAGLMPAHPEADFHTGQSATALYEIRLRKNGSQDVAAVELTWREPGSSKPRRLTRTVRRGQFGSSFTEAPLALQEAALVAQTAEVLRRSPYAVNSGGPPSLGLASVLQLVGHVDSRLYERPTFVRFVSLLDQAAKAKPHSGR